MMPWNRFRRRRTVPGPDISLDKVRARRVLYARLAIVLAVGTLTARLWYLQIVEGPAMQQLATENHVRIETVEPPRGIIYDRYDQQLVENAPDWAVSAYPQDLPPASTTGVLALLAQLTGANLSQMELTVQDARNNGDASVDLITSVPRDMAFNLLAHDEDLPGIVVQAVATRSYVDGPEFSNILGYMGQIDAQQYTASKTTDQPYAIDALVGQSGIEQQYETPLRGQLGHDTVAIDANGNVLNVLKSDAPVAGNSVELTVDATVQRAAYQALQAAMKQSGSTSGAVVALDPRNGAVLALVTSPSFDNNLFSRGVSQADWNRLNTDPTHPLVDHAVAAQYPPGNQVLPFITAGAVQDGVVPASLSLRCPAKIEQNGWDFFTSGAAPVGQLTLSQALGSGCDTLAYILAGGVIGQPEFPAAGLGETGILRWLAAFGFGQRTQIQVGSEAAGFIPDAKWKQAAFNTGWTQTDTYLVAGGAGPLAVTPVQLAEAMAILANGGTAWQPLLVQRVIAPDGTVVSQLKSVALRRVPLNQQTLAAVRAGLADNVATGPAHGVTVAGLQLAGTGGPAAPESTGLGESGLDSWWTGYGPANDPQLVVTVLVAGGSDPAAAEPVARAVFQAALKPGVTMEAPHGP